MTPGNKIEYPNDISVPQVLLVGNGLNLSYGGISWNKLISRICRRSDIDYDRMNRNIPMPLQAILVTNNDIKTAMREQKTDFWGNVQEPEFLHILQKLLRMGFQDILTTNYSYELEIASLGQATVSENQLKKMATCTRGKVEPKYLLHTYNAVRFDDVDNRIWHIHGESRKPDSMILGHYWYANLLKRMKDEIDRSRYHYQYSQEKGIPQKLDSWVDSFILGDVYVLGYGMSPSEIDLWWLLNRKMTEKAHTGKVYFYDLIDKEQYEKIELMKLFGVEVIDFDMHKPDRDNPHAGEIYKEFYNRAIANIEERMMQRANDTREDYHV